MPDLYTFGYQSSGAGSKFIASRLEMTDVEIIVDVRFDRGHGDNYVSEELIEDTVQRAGFSYYWDRGLGNPDYKLPGSRYPNNKPATRYYRQPEAIEPLVGMIESGSTLALMCVCPKALHCHRRLIVNDLLARVPQLRVHHL